MITEKQNKTGLILIFITLLIDCIGIGLIIPVFPSLLKEIGHMSLSESSKWGGFLVTAYALAQFVFGPVIGNLSDRFGRKPIIILSLLGLGADYVFQALSPTLTLLFVGRILGGICGASFTTASAYIADVSTPEKRAQNFGMIGIAFGLGFIIGPLIGGLVGTMGPRVPFWVAACISLVNALLCLFFLPESLDKSLRRPFNILRANPLGALLHIKKYPLVMALMIPLFLLYLASHAVQSNWAFYTAYKFHWNESMLGISLAVVGICIAFVQGGLIRVVVPKLGEKKSIIVGFALYFIGMLLFALATEGYMMFIFTAVYCLGGICGPALQSIMAGSIPANEQGELSGAMTSVMSLTSIFGPLIMNGLFAYFTSDKAPVILPGAPMLLGSLLILIATIIIYPLFKKALIKQKANEQLLDDNNVAVETTQ